MRFIHPTLPSLIDKLQQAYHIYIYIYMYKHGAASID